MLLSTFVFTCVLYLAFRLDYLTAHLFFNNLLSLTHYVLDEANYLFALSLLSIYSIYSQLFGLYEPSFKSTNCSLPKEINNGMGLITSNANISLSYSKILHSTLQSKSSLDAANNSCSFEELVYAPDILGLKPNRDSGNLIYSLELESSPSTSLANHLVANKVNINLNDLNSLSPELSSIINNSVTNSLANAEYRRWLMKTSSATEKLSGSLFNLTQAKILVGNNTYNSNISNNNVWSALNLDNFLANKTYDPIDHTKLLSSNIDNFEESSIFNSRRESLLSQTKSNITTLTGAGKLSVDGGETSTTLGVSDNIINLDLASNIKSTYIKAHLTISMVDSKLARSANSSINYNFKNLFTIQDSMNLFMLDVSTSRTSANKCIFFSNLTHKPIFSRHGTSTNL